MQIPSSRLARWSPLLLGLLACLLALPALKAGMLADDFPQRAVLLHRGELAPFMSPVPDLFSFVKPGRPAELMRDLGYVPWWADPDVRIALFRPLSALTHVLDYALWPDGIALQHLHSLLWLLLGVALVAALYRVVPGMSLQAAAVAGVLFAVEDAHAWPAGWIANRNALVCLVFGAVTLICHIRWRTGRRPRWLVAALLLFAAGLGCGEATLGILAYVVAWQLTMEGDRPRVRSLSVVAAYVGVVLVWRLLYEAAGYGVAGSSLYVDPAWRPLLFLQVLGERWPLLFAGQWLQLPIDLWLLLPGTARIAATLVAAALVVGVVALLRPLLRNPVGRFWAIGMALSIVPVCATFPMARLLLFPGIGAFGLLALLVDGYLLPSPTPDRRRRRAAGALLVLHGPIAAVLLVAGTAALPSWGSFFSAAVPRGPADPALQTQTVVYVNGQDFPVAYSRIIPIAEGAAAPRRVAQLASMTDINVVYREHVDTLVVTPGGGFLAHPIDRLFAREDRPYALGERIERPDFRAEILAVTADGRPASVSFRFRRPLEDPAYRWLYWKDRRLQELELPRVGASVVLPKNTLIPF